jgi:sodium-dependent dicarboxylate transporter 2/3/5
MTLRADEDGHDRRAGTALRLVGLALGLTAAIAIQLAPLPAGLSPQAWLVVSLAALMVIWWVTEAVPPAVTGLLPLALLPLPPFSVVDIQDAAAPYAHPIIILLIGGFVLGAAVERWRLHERVALVIALRSRGRPRVMVGAFMIAACLVSMWSSAAATTLMFAPFGLAAARAARPTAEPDQALGGAVMLGVAYAAAIGAIGTPIGSPTNFAAIDFFRRAGEPVQFLDWTAAAAPIMLIMLPLAWLLLIGPVKGVKREEAQRAAVELNNALANLGKVSAAEARIATVFGCVAFAWMFRPLLVFAPGFEGLSDAGIAAIGAVALFLIPSGRARGERLMDWATAERIPWRIILMFGGALSLAAAIEATEIISWIGAEITNANWPTFTGLVAAMVIATILVSEIVPNEAILTSMLPIAATISSAIGADLTTLAFPVAIAASLAFTLPVASPQNAIAYATNVVTLKRMLIVGASLSIASAVVIIVVTRLVPLVW